MALIENEYQLCSAFLLVTGHTYNPMAAKNRKY